jgi:hypothetical protein
MDQKFNIICDDINYEISFWKSSLSNNIGVCIKNDKEYLFFGLMSSFNNQGNAIPNHSVLIEFCNRIIRNIAFL